MNDHEQRRQEIMRELAKRFKSSSEVMQQIAKRIGEAAERHKANLRRLESTSSRLGDCVEVKNGSLPFSYREFLEFTGDEFERFRNSGPITDDDVRSVDWDELSKGLLG